MATFVVVNGNTISGNIMALEIKATPTLKGKSAERFISIVDKNADVRISVTKRAELINLATSVLKKAKI